MKRPLFKHAKNQSYSRIQSSKYILHYININQTDCRFRFREPGKACNGTSALYNKTKNPSFTQHKRSKRMSLGVKAKTITIKSNVEKQSHVRWYQTPRSVLLLLGVPSQQPVLHTIRRVKLNRKLYFFVIKETPSS